MTDFLPAAWQLQLEALCAQQDYLWFVAFVLAAGVLWVWWQHPERRARTAAAWAAAAVLLHSAAAIVAFLTPYNERSRPLPSELPPNLGSEMMMAAAAGLVAGVWWWRLAGLGVLRRSIRGAGLALIGGLWLLHFDRPTAGGWSLAGVLTLLWGWNRWGKRPDPSIRGGAWFVAGIWLSPWGPLAASANLLHRWGDWSVLCLVCPLLLAGAQVAGLSALLGEALARLPEDRRRELRRSARPFLAGAGCWLAVGLVIAAIASRSARQSFESAALNRVSIAAALFPPAGVTEALGPAFAPVAYRQYLNAAGQKTEVFRSPSTGTAALRPAMDHLRRLFRLNPDVTYVHIVRPHDGNLFAAIPLAWMPGGPGDVYPLRRLHDGESALWRRRIPHTDLGTTANGVVFAVRAPILPADRASAGWLQFDFTLWTWAAAQAQTRLLAFAVVFLGLGLLALWFLRQWRGYEREAALRAAAAAEQANRLKSTFLANVSHELRTPIQSILGYAELLQVDLRGEVEKSRLRALLQHGELMVRLVNDLIDLGALESGAFQVTEKPFAFRQLAEEVVQSLTPWAERKGLKLGCVIGERVPAWVESDPERIRQILLNLVGNAVKFTERGRVDVMISAAEDAGEFRGVEIVVRDTGPGIPDLQRLRLFAPFSRLANAGRAEGTGLGLALTAGLCRRLGHGLEVESDGRTGSLFRATLRVRPSRAPSPPNPAARASLTGMRILVADDNLLVRDLFVAYLSGLGAECSAASDGQAALARMAEFKPDAVILDLAMPDLGGCAVARELRAGGSRVRLVGVSAHAGAAERAEALAAGMDVFLSKPVELAALARALGPVQIAKPADSWDERRAFWEAMFRDELPAEIARIEAALGGPDWVLLAHRAHYLKNSAAVVRDDALFEACGELETAARGADAAAAAAALARCRNASAGWREDPAPAFRSPSRPA